MVLTWQDANHSTLESVRTSRQIKFRQKGKKFCHLIQNRKGGISCPSRQSCSTDRLNVSAHRAKIVEKGKNPLAAENMIKKISRIISEKKIADS